MSTMSLLRAAANPHRLIRTISHNQRLLLLLPNSPMHFSTQAADQPSSQGNISFDSFLPTPPKGFVYGKLIGTTKHTSKSDILNLLGDSRLSLDDVKVDYSLDRNPRTYTPSGMMIRFPSWDAFDAALKANARKGRVYRLDRADQTQWDAIARSAPFDGKAVLLQGIPQSAVMDDIERFLSGCVHDASKFELFSGPSQNQFRTAIAYFPSKTQAMHAFMTKNGGFILNSRILVRVLH